MTGYKMPRTDDKMLRLLERLEADECRCRDYGRSLCARCAAKCPECADHYPCNNHQPLS